MVTKEQKRKKRKKVLKIVGALVGVLLLVSCCGIGGLMFLGSEPTTTSVPTVVATATPTATVTMTPTHTPTAAPSPTTNTPQYRAEMRQLLRRYIEAQVLIAEANQLMADNPHLAEDNLWLRTMNLAFGQALAIGEEIRALNPPPEYEEAHACIVKSTRYFDAFIDLYSSGVDNLDATLIIQAVEELEEAGKWMDKANEAMPD